MYNWQSFRLRLEWEGKSEPKWWLDLFILDNIVRDLISDNRKNIKLWRFHRRAARDHSGHQLTIYCYTQKKVGYSINNQLLESDLFELLNKTNLLKEYQWNEEHGSERNMNKIEDTSDPNWPIEIKKAWPFYIMGVCDMFLDLIKNLSENMTNKRPKIASLKRVEPADIYYRELNKLVSDTWNINGNHAFFHHINAIFGYVPLSIYPRSISGSLASF